VTFYEAITSPANLLEGLKCLALIIGIQAASLAVALMVLASGCWWEE
jgi:hypothetical protein